MLTTSNSQGKCSLNLKCLLLSSFQDEAALVSFQTRNIISCPLVLNWRAMVEAGEREQENYFSKASSGLHLQYCHTAAG